MTSNLVRRYMAASVTPRDLPTFLAELQKDTAAAASWLVAFERRGDKELETLATSLEKSHPEYRSAIQKAMDRVTFNLRRYKVHPYAANIDFVSPFSYYEQEFDDPENYADGQTREPKDYDQLLAVASKLEATARTFTDRLLDKYGIKTRKNLKALIPPEQHTAYMSVWEHYFSSMDDLPEGLIGALKKLHSGLERLQQS